MVVNELEATSYSFLGQVRAFHEPQLVTGVPGIWVSTPSGCTLRGGVVPGSNRRRRLFVGLVFILKDCHPGMGFFPPRVSLWLHELHPTNGESGF